MFDFMDVEKFHSKFGLPMGQVQRPMSQSAFVFRHRFLWEEASEFSEACAQRSMVHTVDALLDLNYVVFGTMLFIGIPRTGEFAKTVPYYTQVSLHCRELALIPSRAPAFLHEHMQVCLEAEMKHGIQGFERAHIAAEFGANNAIELCLLHLAAMARNIYAIAYLMGVPWDRCWKHVQAANMAKQRAKINGEDSKRSSSWDVVKPEGWIAPDAAIAHELMAAGWKAPEGTEIDRVTGKVTHPEGD